MATATDLLNFDLNGLQHQLQALGEPSFRATQIYKWIHQSLVNDFEQMTNLSKALRVRLGQQAVVGQLPVILDHQSKDGTRKWLFQLHDGNAIETVFIPENGRGTLCVSSQVGCALNCRFCATAAQGFNRNLTVSEIITQLRQANQLLQTGKRRSVTNVVMMGMGEPLLNYDNVLTAMNIMMDDQAYGLSKYRVTLSTSGVVPAIQQLKEDSDVALALSLHAPTDDLRNKLVPINKKYPLEMLLNTCRDYFARGSKRKITIEYVMLDGINDSPTHARALAKCLRNIPVKINLIPFNPFPGTIYRKSPDAVIHAFRTLLIDCGYLTTVRKTRGDDIAAACGQLKGDFLDRTSRRRRQAYPAETPALATTQATVGKPII